MKLQKASSLKGEITIPGDKSISHRAIMLGSLAKGTTKVTGFLMGEDCLSTIDCFRKMGVSVDIAEGIVTIEGLGLHGLQAPTDTLYTGNSGTTTRILSGILCGQRFTSQINGDESIQKRPMKRIIDPLNLMGADIRSINDNGCAPMEIRPATLHGINYDSKIASAQLKSALLFAGLYAEGNTSFTEPYLSRNHTEIMMNSFGGNVIAQGTTTTITPEPAFTGREVFVPGDISSAAFFIVAGLITPNSEILIKNVGINPTRMGIISVCKEMGGNVELQNEHTTDGEPYADILVRTSDLHGITIEGNIIPTLIDELPVIAVMAACAKGTTTIKDAAELKVKESNRIDYMVSNLSAMGADIVGTDDGMIITGGKALHGATIDSAKDHRIAMSIAIASLVAEGETHIPDYECVNISYPDFFSTLESLKL